MCQLLRHCTYRDAPSEYDQQWKPERPGRYQIANYVFATVKEAVFHEYFDKSIDVDNADSGSDSAGSGPESDPGSAVARMTLDARARALADYTAARAKKEEQIRKREEGGAN